MDISATLNRVFRFSSIFSLLISTAVYAGDPMITASFSGVWDQPEQESHGIVLQIGEQINEEGVEDKIGIAFWFTYGPDLQTSWYLGVGDIIGHEIKMVLYTASDIGFMAPNQEGDENVEPVGSLNLDFRNCNHGIATFEFTDGEVVTDSGEFPIKRMSSIYRQRCSGGISDDTPAHGKPLQMDVHLYPVEQDGSGAGHAKFWERTDRSDFKVAVERLPDGDAYSVQICGDNADPDVEVQQFDILIVEGSGELEFRSPEIADKLNLNFDPRGCKIELLDNGVAVLSSGEAVLNEKTPGKPDNKGDGDDVQLKADFTSTEVIVGAEGEAEFEIDSHGSELSVKIKNVPAGFYAVHIDGVNQGDIEVIEDNGKLQGKVKLAEPPKDGALELLTDPRGQLIEIRQNAVAETPVILEALFPSE